MPHTETVPQAPGALPVIGHLARLGLDPLRFFVELHACGPLVRIRLGHRTVYVVTSADLVQHMLVANHGDYDRGGPFMDSARALLGNGLPACPDSVQRVQRPLLQAAFQRNQMPRYIERMAAFTARSVAAWPCGRVIDADTEMRQLATGNLTQSLFRDPVVGRLVTQFQHDLPIVMDGLARRVVLPISGRLPFPGNRRFTRAVRRTDAAIEQMVRHRRSSDDGYDDLLTALLSPRSHAEGLLTDKLVRDHMWGFMMGGIDTTSSLMAWALHWLVTQPAFYERIQREVDTVLGGEPPTYESLAHLQQLQRLLTEVLRLYPSVWISSRVTRRATVLGGHTLAPGAGVFFSIWALHRDPEVFPDADRFLPDRWLEEHMSPKQRAGFLPFGTGPRKCIGDTFGFCQATATLAVLLQQRRLRPGPGYAAVPRGRMTQHPTGVSLIAEAR